MPKKNTYADWLKAEQTNINDSPSIVRPVTTLNGYASLMARNAEIANTPETARGNQNTSADRSWSLLGDRPYIAPVLSEQEVRDRKRKEQEASVARFKQFASNAVKNAPTLANNFGYGLYRQPAIQRGNQNTSADLSYSALGDRRYIAPTATPQEIDAAKKRAAIAKGNQNTNADYFTDEVKNAPTLAERIEALKQAKKEEERRQRENAEGYVFDRTAKKETIKDIKSGNKSGAIDTNTEATAPAAEQNKHGDARSSFADLVRSATSKVLQTMKQAKDKLAEAEDQKNGSAPATDAGTTDAELTGYAKFLADHPEYDEANRLAEAEYARSLPTYGALAERMAQAGIHGGYSDYLQGVAYAKMQDAKQQNEEAARAGYAAFTGNGGTVMSDTAKELYKNLLSEYGDQIAGITDETQYTQFEDLFRSANKGLYSEADINSALGQAREYRQTSLNNAKADTQALVKQYGTGEKTSDDILAAYGISIKQGIDENGNEMKDGESDADYEKRKQETVRWVLSQAVKDGLIDDKELSATVKDKLAIYSEDFKNKTSWKSKGEDIYNSVSTAIDDNKEKVLSDDDLKTVLNDALTKMGVTSLTLDATPTGGVNADVVLELPGGVKLKADYNGKASETVADYLSSNYGNLPIVVYNDKLYYQNPIERESDGTYKTEWCVLKTKAGSEGTPEQGDAYFRTVAKIMMKNNETNKVEGLLKYTSSNHNAKQTWNIATGKHE